MFHGNGGYDWGTVYNMPIWLRRLTFKYINSYFEEQNEKNKQSTPQAAKSIPKGPNISPSYSTKASR